jgi:hypothetical protein
MSDVRSCLGDVAQPSWLWVQRASCPLIQPGTMPGSPRRLEPSATKLAEQRARRKLAPPAILEDRARIADA